MGLPYTTHRLSEGAIAAWADTSRAEAEVHLTKVLESLPFRSSKRCSRFLKYIVESALDNRFDCLKERLLGVVVFEREPNYDTNQDPVVRGTAGEVRKRLAQYYLETGQHDPIRFVLPSGTYIPELHHVPSSLPHVELQPPSPPDPVIAPSVRTRKQRRTGTMALAAVVALAALAAFPLLNRFRSSNLDRFWAPILGSGAKSVLVCMGQPQLYTFRYGTAMALNDWFGGDRDDLRGKPGPPSIPVSDVLPVWGEAVALADGQAFSRLLTSFARHSQVSVDMRGERSVTLADLRRQPAIFIGAFDNDWNLRLTSGLRFYFDQDLKSGEQLIRDRLHPDQTGWNLTRAWPVNTKIGLDYAIVTRAYNRTTEQTVVALGGISQYGTGAAAELVTNPEYFSRVVALAPRDWAHKNMQIVISTRVLTDTAGPPTIVAVHFW